MNRAGFEPTLLSIQHLKHYILCALPSKRLFVSETLWLGVQRLYEVIALLGTGTTSKNLHRSGSSTVMHRCT